MIVIDPELNALGRVFRLYDKAWKKVSCFKSEFAILLLALVNLCTLSGKNLFELFLPDGRQGILEAYMYIAILLFVSMLFLLLYSYRKWLEHTNEGLYSKSFHEIAHAIRSIHSNEEIKNEEELVYRTKDAIFVIQNDSEKTEEEKAALIAERENECDSQIAKVVQDRFKRSLNDVCKIIYETVEKKGIRINAVTIKCRVDETLIRIGRHSTSARTNQRDVSLDGVEHWNNSPFYALLSRTAHSYSKICREITNKKFKKAYRILALHDVEKLARDPPLKIKKIIYATMDTFNVDMIRNDDFASGIARKICQDLPSRVNKNYLACLGVPILPASETPDAKDYEPGVPGFIGIDSNDAYIWDALDENLIAFLAAIADLLHNIIVPELLDALIPQ